MPSALRTRVEQMTRAGVPPKVVHNQLYLELGDENLPSLEAVRNFMRGVRRKARLNGLLLVPCDTALAILTVHTHPVGLPGHAPAFGARACGPRKQ